MTFIVVPHGSRDLSTRSFEVSYRRLRVVGVLLLVAVTLWLGTVASWAYMAGQAARVPGLERQIRELESDRARVVQLAEALRRLEIQYEQVRRMLGAGGAAESLLIVVPPAESPDEAATATGP